MCVHILKPNGPVLQRTTVGPLTPSEMGSGNYMPQMEHFMSSLYQGPLGHAMTTAELKAENDAMYTCLL